LDNGDSALNNPPPRSKSRRISFSSTISEAFVVRKGLTEGLVESAMQYWKSKGMTIKSVQKPRKFSGNPDLATVEFVAEGGSIWTTSFESYKKTIRANLSVNAEHTDVKIEMVLPGGLMSLQDREKAADLIESFHDALENYRS
jgi:hypothetical protein